MNILSSYKQSESFSFNDLPEEVFLRIAHYCEVKELGRLSCVSKKISQIANGNNIWKTRYDYDAPFQITNEIANDNNLWKIRYDCNAPFQITNESDNYKQSYCDDLKKENILFLQGSRGKTRKVVYNKNTLLIDLKSFIFNKYCLSFKDSFHFSVKTDESQVRVIYYNDYPRGRVLAEDNKKISEYNIPTQTTLPIMMKGFQIHIE